MKKNKKKSKKQVSLAIATVMVSNSLVGSLEPVVAYSQYSKSIDNSTGILGEFLQKEHIVTFPNAMYSKTVTGFEIKTGVPTKYTLNGAQETSEEGIISSKDILSGEEFTNLLRSLELDVRNSDATIEVKVGEEKDGFKYFNGNYYKIVNVDDYVTLDEYRQKMVDFRLFGVDATPMKIESKKENDFIIDLLGSDNIKNGIIKPQLAGFRDSNNENFKWFDGSDVIIPNDVVYSYSNGAHNSLESLLIIGYNTTKGVVWADVDMGNSGYTPNVIIAEIDSKDSIVGNVVAIGTIDQYEETVPSVEEDIDVKEEINSIDISKGLENAVVKSNKDYILGFKVEATSSTGVKFIYSLGDEEVTNNSKTLNFYAKYTVQEVQDILRSMKVESNSNVKLKVTLGNIREGLKYLEHTGHYYEVVESKNGITWTKAKTEATKLNYLGNSGYLAVITSEEENELIASHTISDGLSGAKAILLGASDAEKEGVWKWINGEPFEYTNWAPGSPNDGTRSNQLYTHDNASAKRGKWDDGGDTPFSAYAVEYGDIDEKLPAPTKNVSSEVVIESTSDLNLGVTSYSDNVISFPNASAQFQGVARLNIVYGLGYNSNIVTNYTVNGQKKSISSKVVKTENLTNEQMNEVLSSLTITGKDSNQSLSFTITIDCGQQIYLYNPTNGHYYGIFSALPSYTANKEMAESQEYLGEKGYIVTPMNEEEDAFLSGIVDSDFWLGIKYDTSKKNLVYDGGYKKGEVITFEKEWNKRPNSSTPYAHANDKRVNGLWTYCGESTGICTTPVYTVVEFGGEERMPTPVELGETMSETVYIGSTLKLGDYVEENGELTFPNYDMSVSQPVKLVITYNEGHTENVITKYMLDGKKYSLNDANITISNLNEEQLKEILDSLIISGYSKSRGLNLTIKIVSDYDIDDSLTSTDIIIEGKDETAPIIEGVADKQYTIGDGINLKEGVTATDDVDEDLTDEMDVKVEEVKGYFFDLIKIKKEVPDIDNSREGEYNVTYSVSDKAGNEAIEKCVVNVDKAIEDVIELDLRKEVIEDDIITFPYARVKGTLDNVSGIQLTFLKGYDDAQPKLTYIENGEVKTVSGKEVVINGQMSLKEVQKLVRSIKIEKVNDKSFDFNISLYSNGVEALRNNMVQDPISKHYYEYVDYKTNWNNAKSLAEQREFAGVRGYLACIGSQEENELLLPLLDKTSWIGLYEESNNNWKWVNGDKFTYNNFDVGQPSGGEPCVEIMGRSYDNGRVLGKWNDVSAYSTFGGLSGYIVEYPVKPVSSVSYTFDETAPTIEGADKEVEIIEGTDFNPLEGIIVSDDMSEPIVNVTYTNPNGKKVDVFDSNIIGKWVVHYDVVDDKGNKINIDRNVTVIMDEEINSVDISNGLENAVVESSRDFIMGFKVESEGLSSNGNVLYEYVLNGNMVRNNNKVLNFYGMYTPQEVQDILRSMKIISATDIDVTVTLGNLHKDLKYNAKDGHYYELIRDSKTWEDAKIDSEKREFLGTKGYLATIYDENTLSIINSFEDTGSSWYYLVGLQSDSNGNHTWLNKAPFTYNRFYDSGSQNEKNGKYVLANYNSFRSISSSQAYYYLVEYGNYGERVPKPTLNTSSSVRVSSNIYPEDVEEIESNFIDISKGLENTVVESSRDYIIGFKVEGVSDNDIKYTYSLKGKTVENTNKVLNFYDKYTVDEVQTILRSMKVESDSNVELTVTLGNLHNDMKYHAQSGHYYELVRENTTWKNANNESKQSNYLGINGYLATVIDDSVLDIVRSFEGVNSSWFLHIGLESNGNCEHSWVNGMPLLYENWYGSHKNSANAQYMLYNYDKFYAVPSTTTKYYYLTEFGQPNERLPRPTVNTSSSVIIHSVEPQEENSIDISNGLENAVVTSSRGYIIGFKIEGVSDKDIKYTYTLNDEIVENTNKVLNFYDKYTAEEVQEILRSLKVESKSDVELTVTLGNLKPDMMWEESVGHYFTVNTTNSTWQQAKVSATQQSFLGKQGYLGTIYNEEHNNAITEIGKKYSIPELWIGLTDEEVEGTYKWVNGSAYSYTNWYPGQPSITVNTASNHDYAELIINRNGQWGMNRGDANTYNKVHIGYITEYGQPDERLPRPTENTSSSVKVESTVETILNLGEMVLDSNKTATFPSAEGTIKDTDNLVIEFTEGYLEGNKVTYTLNNGNVTESSSKVVINDLTTETLDEVLKSLKIESVEGETVKFKVYLDSIGDTIIERPTLRSYEGNNYNDPSNLFDGTEDDELGKNYSISRYYGNVHVDLAKPTFVESLTVVSSLTPTTTYTYTVKTEVDGVEKIIGIGSHKVDLSKPKLKINVENGVYDNIKLEWSTALGWGNSTIEEFYLNDTIWDSGDKEFIIDRKKPVISNIEDKEYVVFDKINLKEGIEVIDDVDGNITDNIDIRVEKLETKFFGLIKTSKIVENIDNSKAGNYIVTYTATDSSGNTDIKKSSVSVSGIGVLNLGEPKVANGKITFPNAEGRISERANLQINIFDGYVGNEINYTLNNTKRSHIVPEVVVKGVNTSQLSEILRTLSFDIDYGQELDIQVVLTDDENNTLYEDISVGEDSNLNVMKAIDNDLSTSWSEDSTSGIATYIFDGDKDINSVEVIHHSTSDSEGNTYIIEGLVDGTWSEIGRTTTKYLELLEEQMAIKVNVANGTYNGIRITINNTTENVRVYDIKFNGTPKKNANSKNNVTVSLDADTQKPIITPSHSDMEYEKGSIIPKITASATDNDYKAPNLTSQIKTTILNPDGDERDYIDNMVVGKWTVRFEVEDRSGNKAKEEVIVTITPDVTKPILTGVRGGVVKQGEPYSLTAMVKATDNVDKDLTNEINITYIDPSGAEQPNLDDSVKGDWKVKYSVSDKAGNVTEQEVTVRVELDAVIELGEPLVNKEDNMITFPNNHVELQPNDTKQFRMRFTKGGNSIVTYTVDGQTYTHTGNFTANIYTEGQIKQMLDTLSIKYTDTVEFETGIVNEAYMPLGINLHDNLVDGNKSTFVDIRYNDVSINFNGVTFVDTLKMTIKDIHSLKIVTYNNGTKQQEIPLTVWGPGYESSAVHNITDRSVSIKNSLVDKIELNKTSWVMPSLHELLIENFSTKNSYNKVFIDLTPPIISTNYGDLDVWQGHNIPNIVGTVTDDTDNNLELKKTVLNPDGLVSDSIDNMVVGEWIVRFETEDKSGNKAVKDVKVTVKEDTEEPVITPNYESLEVEKGRAIPVISATAKDNSGQLNGSVIKTIIDPNGEEQKAIDNKVEGRWIVKFEVSDKAGNQAVKEVEVTITPDITPPTIGMSPNTDITVEQGMTVQKITANATDIVDGTITDRIVTTILNPQGEEVDYIDTMIVGQWKVKFEVSDDAGNKAVAERIVNVVKNTNAPKITGVYDRTIERGILADVNQMFEVTDDNGLKSVEIEVKDPNGIIRDNIDTNIVGEWSIRIKACDVSDNESEGVVKYTVTDYITFKLSNPKTVDGITRFDFDKSNIVIPEHVSRPVIFTSNKNITVTYSIDGNKKTYTGMNIETENIDMNNIKEFISTLEITGLASTEIDISYKGCTFNPVVKETKQPNAFDSNTQSVFIQKAPSTGSVNTTVSATFVEKYKISSVQINSNAYGYWSNALVLYSNGKILETIKRGGGLKPSEKVSAIDDVDGISLSLSDAGQSGSRHIYIWDINVTQRREDNKVFIDMSAPNLKGIRGGTIKQGEPFDLLKNITVIDDLDEFAQDSLQLKCISPNGEEMSNIDDSIFGEWTIIYSAEDRNGNKAEIEEKVIVEPSDTIKLGEEFITEDGYISFRGNEIELQEDVCHKLKFYFTSIDDSEIRYFVNGLEKVISVSNSKVIELPSYNEEQLKEVLNTLKIKYTGHIEFRMGVSNNSYMPFGSTSNKPELVDNINNTTNNFDGGVQINLVDSTYIQRIDLGASISNVVIEAFNKDELVVTKKGNGRYFDLDGIRADKLVITGNGTTSEIKIDNYSTENTYNYKDIKSSLTLTTEKEDETVTGIFDGTGTFERYELERRNSITNEYTVIQNLTNKTFTDILKDTFAPTIDLYLQRGKEENVSAIVSSDDNNVDYYYRVKAYNGTTLSGISNESVQTLFASGVKGYVYVVDENADTELSDVINSEDGILNLDNVNENTYLHIKAIDNEGNSSETLHIQLLDSSYNNAPIIKTSKNKVVEFGTEFNPMEGVDAYDYEDGNLNDDVEIEGLDKLNTSKIGSYKLIYSVTDKGGKTTREEVTVHVTGNMTLDVDADIDSLILNWSNVDNVKKYRIYRSEADGFSYNIYKDVDSKTTSFVDDKAIDTKAPIISDIYEINKIPTDTEAKGLSKLLSKILFIFNNSELKIDDRDLGSTYRYYIQALNEGGEVINSTNIEQGCYASGVKGYAYVIDENSSTQAPTRLNALNKESIEKAIEGQEGKILHIRAIDNSGNVGETVHYLIGSKHITNYVPVIYGVKPRKVELGDTTFSLMDGISAYDVEDGIITDKIECISDFNINKEGVYSVTYKVVDKHNNERVVSTTITVVKYNNLTAKGDKDLNRIVLSWDDSAITDKDVYYEVRKLNEYGVYTQIGTTKDTTFIDELSEDKKGAKYLGNNKKVNDDGTLTVTINASDVGYSAKYQVFTRLKSDNTIIGTMNDLKTGTESGVEGNITGGIKGYSWHLSNVRLDTVDYNIKQIDSNITFDPEDYEWLHIAPIDIYGNKGDTIHIQLKKVENGESIDSLPVINIENTIVELGKKFNPVINGDVSAYDNEDGNISDRVTYEGSVDVNAEGDYPIIYSVMDNDGNSVSKEAIITVSRPVIELPNDSTTNLPQVNNKLIVYDWGNPDYIEVGSDKYDFTRKLYIESTKDGIITNQVEYNTNLDLNNLGIYIINYHIQDSVGNEAYFQRVVNVVKKGEIPPYISDSIVSLENINVPYFEEFDTIECYVGDNVNPLSGVKAYDIEDGNLTSRIKMTGVVNTIKPGYYTVQFKVTDNDGNTSYATRGIVVYDRVNDNDTGETPNNPGTGDNDNGNNGGGVINPPEQPEQPDVPKPPTDGSGSGNNGSNGNENDIEDVLPDDNINIDTDGDGKPDVNIDTDGDGKPDVNIDTDGDGKPDVNIDTDGDGKPDVNIDTDGDGKPNLNIDIDGDNKPDINIDTDGDGKADINIDTDGDGKADVNIDTDGDGKADVNIVDKPKTNDTIVEFAVAGMFSALALVFNNKKNKKRKK